MAADRAAKTTRPRARPPRPRFTRPVLDAIAKGMVIGIRAGRAPHRFIGIWAVVANGRVFVRSWSREERSCNSYQGDVIHKTADTIQRSVTHSTVKSVLTGWVAASKERTAFSGQGA